MSKRVSAGGVVRLVAGALMVSLVMAPAAFAKGDDHNGNDRSIPNCSRHNNDNEEHEGRGGEDKLDCPNKQVEVRIDEKLCPEKPNRPAVIRKRVCCRHGNLTNCHPFRPCPPRSRS